MACVKGLVGPTGNALVVRDNGVPLYDSDRDCWPTLLVHVLWLLSILKPVLQLQVNPPAILVQIC
jgi:hypothetical protein